MKKTVKSADAAALGKTSPKTKSTASQTIKASSTPKTSTTKTVANKSAASKTGTQSAAKKKPAKRPVKRAMRGKLTKAEIESMFAILQADNPQPKGDLEYSNAYTLLVAVALSAQATDVGVNKATRELFKLADTPEKMLALGEDKLRELIRTIGLYRNKAKNVYAMSQILVDEFSSEVPADRDALMRLPGVGRKTANVVLNNAFAQPTIAVDTHLFRFANRTGLAPGKDPLAVELALLKVVPEAYLLHAHHWLILHGRYICIARKPKCALCIIEEHCKFKDKTVD